MTERRTIDRPSELARIRISTPVIDVTGRLVGWVKYVKHGTPNAAPITEHPSADDDLETAFARALTQADPKVGANVADELIRNGFLKVASFGPADDDVYVLANQIAAADDDTVRLSASIEDLLAEHETPL